MEKGYLYILLMFLLVPVLGNAQQDPQYTQYMFNTQIVNPAYAGTGEALSFGLLYRTQWVGFEGAPNTGTFTANTPIGALQNMGLGLSFVSESIGPAIESNINIDYAYRLQTGTKGQISFGLKAGLDLLDVDFNKLQIDDESDPFLQGNIDNKLQPQIGAGVYYYENNFYVGLSTPNFLTTKHFDESSIENTQVTSVSSESIHYFLIAGYVFDVNQDLKFKPATLIKLVSGSPLQWDATANFLYKEKFHLGAAYRWSAGLSALAGFQINENMYLGVGYDYETTDIQTYSDGSYEFIFRYNIFNKPDRVLTPRFF